MLVMQVKLWLLSTSLVFVSWWLNFSLPPRNPPLVNYDSKIFFSSSSVLGPLDPFPSTSGYFAPHTKEELVRLVKAVWKASKGPGPRRHIRVVGAGHSWSAVAQSEDLLLSLANYKGLVSLDSKSQQATFRGGTTLKEVNAILEDYGLAMTQLGSISDQTVAGAIATGTHGTGILIGNLATLVRRLELITGEGKVLTLSSTDEDTDLFRAAQVNLGLLGVVTEVTFQCEPLFNLEETLSVVPLEVCLSDMERLVHSAQYVKMWVEVFSGTCALHQTNRTQEEPRDNPSSLVGTAENVFFEVFLNVLSWFPNIIPSSMIVLFKYGDPIPPHNRVDRSYKVFNIPHYISVHNEAEVLVGIEDCAPAIRELKAFVEEEGIPLNYITEVRFVQKDNISLSPNYQRDSCHLSICIANAADHDRLRYFHGFFSRLVERDFKPRVHWGKYFDLSSTTIGDLLPDVKNFLKNRQRLDPENIFLNKLLSNALEIE